MLGISPMVGIWGVPHAPMTDAAAIRENARTPIRTEDASYLGSQPQAPNISDGVYLGVTQAPRCIWGVPHAPNVRRCRYSGECPNPNQEDASYLGSQPKPPVSPMACIWEMPKPQGVYGEHPMPPMSDAAAIRGVRTQRETQAIWGANPKPPISPMACIWELPKPQGIYGECPMPPDIVFHFLFIILHFSLFIIHFHLS